MPESKQEYYKEMRTLANDSVIRSGQGLDYIIFAATTGALVLASGLIGNFSHPTILLTILIAISIASLLAALFVHSISYKRSIKFNTDVVRKLDEWHNNGYQESFKMPDQELGPEGRGELDMWAFRLMWVGLIFLTLFILLNIINNNYYGTTKWSGRRSQEITRQHFERFQRANPY